VAGFLALRRRRWGWAAAAGFLAGLTRPVGALLVVPAAIEAARGLRGAPPAERLSRALAVASPVAGTCVFLGWVGARFGDTFLPLRIQNRPDLRGGFANPVMTVWRALDGVLHGQAGTNGIHLPWVLILAVLVVVTLRRWPLAYGAYAAATFVVALSAHQLGSFERYGFGAFPVALGLASVLEASWSERLVLTAAAAIMAGYALCAFLHIYVP
jgi:hypothetical protein